MLNDREREFVSDMAWKVRFRELTEKQASWLRSIYGRLRAREAREVRR